MKERDFCYWLMGTLNQVNEGDGISIELTESIRKMLEEVLNVPEFILPYHPSQNTYTYPQQSSPLTESLPTC